MLIQESFVDATSMVGLGENPICEPYQDSVGDLFRACQKEYGRCISRMYIDNGDSPRTVGWVFASKRQYEDWNPYRRGDRYYIREVWVRVWTGAVFVCQQCNLVHPMDRKGRDVASGALCKHCAHGHVNEMGLTDAF